MNLVGTKTFKGGVHPQDGKKLSCDCPITRLAPKGELIYLMTQHIGAPAKPIVSVGDRVLLGQTIAQAGGFVSADICASVSGTVKKIAAVPNTNGDEVTAVFVENDCEYEAVEGYGDYRDYSLMSKDEIRAAVKNAGLVGMGGAGFPTSVKLSVKDDTAIDYVLVNGAECEPYITCDYRLMIERTEKAVLGLKILLRLFDNAKGVFAIENNKPEGIKCLNEAIGSRQRMYVQPLKKKYPQGGERMIISAVTGRKINSKKLPADAGCVVINYATLLAVADAVAYNMPLTQRVITVTGDAISTPANFEVPIGMSAREIVEAAGGFTQDPEKVVFGGPMMGSSVSGIDTPVTKTTSCILCFKQDDVAALHPSACIRCGKCLEACPEQLMPMKLKNHADAYEYDEFEKAGGLECIGCGSCTYICPARRRLSQSISVAKRHVLAEKKKKGVK